MTKKFEFNWRIEVPELLRNGSTFDRWFEDKETTEYEPNCLFKVDEYGFFIYWKSDGKVYPEKKKIHYNICSIERNYKIMNLFDEMIKKYIKIIVIKKN